MNVHDWIFSEQLFKVNEAAFACKMNPDVLRKWIRLGKVRAYGRPRFYRVKLSDVMPILKTGTSDTEK